MVGSINIKHKTCYSYNISIFFFKKNSIQKNNVLKKKLKYDLKKNVYNLF